MRTSLWITNRQTSIFVYRMSCFAQVGRLHASGNNILKTPLRYWVAVEVIGDELALPRFLKHHRIAILAPAIHANLRATTHSNRRSTDQSDAG